MATASVFDVAAYILKKKGPVSHMKLQKLVYYSQAWSLVWDDKPLFSQKIEAWRDGPVVPRLFSVLKGKFTISLADVRKLGDAGALGPKARETVDHVLDFYGDKNSQWLSDLTHLERPWLKAREGVPAGQRCSNEITHASMAEYYASI